MKTALLVLTSAVSLLHLAGCATTGTVTPANVFNDACSIEAAAYTSFVSIAAVTPSIPASVVADAKAANAGAVSICPPNPTPTDIPTALAAVTRAYTAVVTSLETAKKIQRMHMP
jgi:hypothetical protein